MKFRKFARTLGIALVSLSLLAGCSNPSPLTQSNSSSSSQPVTRSNISSNSSSSSNTTSNYGGITSTQKSQLAALDYKSGENPVIQVNNGKSTLTPKSWTSNHVIYSNLDSLNRTSNSNTAFLEQRNHAQQSLRVRQYVQPTGWHSNHGRTQYYNRGHLIAYSVSAGIDQNGNYEPNNTSGDQNNPKNLFTQTAYSNQELQTIYETKVRNAIEQEKRSFIKQHLSLEVTN